jgi:hypothetical protein
MIEFGKQIFQGRKLIIATKHQKESVIAPILEKELGVHCFIIENFDTDALGTFTGEIERELDPISTAREKCIRAMDLSNCDLGIASEGSFGPHPSLFFTSADDEFLIFIDRKNKLEIIARELSTSTNFDGQQIQNEKELREFINHVSFPTHALILSKSKEDKTDMIKGITNYESLVKSANALILKYGSAYVETDMRAMYNPTRMRVIQKAAEKLVHKIKSTCPQCQAPGFGITDTKKGLQCSLCGLPTNSILSAIYECQHCQFKKEDMYPHQKTTENPTYCDYCNP